MNQALMSGALVAFILGMLLDWAYHKFTGK
jgi:hypothetical protein